MTVAIQIPEEEASTKSLIVDTNEPDTPRKKKKRKRGNSASISHCKKMSSPLKPLLSFLKVLRYLGGFPLEETKDDGVEWRLNKMAWAISWAAVVFVMGFFVIVYAYMGATLPEGLGQLADNYLEEHMTLTELFVVLTAFTINSYLIVVYMRSLNKLFPESKDGKPVVQEAQHFSTMCLKMSYLNKKLSVPDGDVSKLGFANIRTIVMLYLKHMVAVGLDAYVNYSVLPDTAEGTKVLCIVSFTLAFLILGWPFLSCSYQLINCQIFDVLNLQLGRFAEKLKVKKTYSPTKKSSDFGQAWLPPDPADLSHKGEDAEDKTVKALALVKPQLVYSDVIAIATTLYEVTDLVDKVFGHFLFPTLGVCCIYMVSGIFGSLHILDAFNISGVEIHWVAFCFSCTNLLFALHSFVRAKVFFTGGQKVASNFLEIRLALEDYYLEMQTAFSEEERNRLRVLISRFDNHAPIRPFDAIDLTSNSGLRAAGLLLTYLIILVEFKLGDREEMYAGE